MLSLLFLLPSSLPNPASPCTVNKSQDKSVLRFILPQSHGSLHFGPPSEPFIGDSHSRSGGWWFCWFWKTRGAKELSFGLRNMHLAPNAAWSLLHSLLPPPSKQSISVVLQGKHIYWLVTACQCGSSGPVAEGISLGRGQGENGGN